MRSLRLPSRCPRSSRSWPGHPSARPGLFRACCRRCAMRPMPRSSCVAYGVLRGRERTYLPPRTRTGSSRWPRCIPILPAARPALRARSNFPNPPLASRIPPPRPVHYTIGSAPCLSPIRLPRGLGAVRFSDATWGRFAGVRGRGILRTSHWKGCRPLRRVRGPSAIRLRLQPEITALRFWSAQLLAGLLLSLLLIVRLFLLRFLLGTELGVEHSEYDPHETHQPNPARQADP
jgi:hypothetical protein